MFVVKVVDCWLLLAVGGGCFKCVVYSFVVCGFVENVVRVLYVADMKLASRYRHVMRAMLLHAARLPWLLPVAIWIASHYIYFHSSSARRSPLGQHPQTEAGIGLVDAGNCFLDTAKCPVGVFRSLDFDIRGMSEAEENA